MYSCHLLPFTTASSLLLVSSDFRQCKCCPSHRYTLSKVISHLCKNKGETMAAAPQPKYLVILTLVSFVSFVICTNPLSTYEVLLSWKGLDFKWPAPQTRERLLTTKEYIPENNVITGIKVWGSKIYLTVPRWRMGVPSTLNMVDLNQTSGSIMGAPLLVPYPGWDMQQLGNCNAFQYVQSMEIDRWGRMWVVDVGRVDIFKNREAKCKAKMVLVDLNTDEVLHKYEFPEEVVSPQTNFLNDVVVACGEEEDKQDCYAYITDAKDGKLVVYNLKENRSWFVRHPSMLADPAAVKMDILGGNYSFNVNIDGIALSPRSSGHDRVYYSPLSSFSLFSVPTSILKESVNGVTLRDSDVTTHQKHRSSQSDGLAMDASGLLFYGLLQNNSIVYVNTTAPKTTTSDPFQKEILLVENDVDLQWPDTFAFDDQGYLYTVSNRLQRYSTDTCDWSEVNFRVARIFVGSLSYQYRKEDKVQQNIPVDVDSTSFTNPTNLDNNAPDTPVGVDGKHIYDHSDNKGLDDNQLGDGNDTGYHHSHQHGDLLASADTSSAPTINEHLPVVLFLSVLMYNPALRP